MALSRFGSRVRTLLAIAPRAACQLGMESMHYALHVPISPLLALAVAQPIATGESLSDSTGRGIAYGQRMTSANTCHHNTIDSFTQHKLCC